MCLVFVAYRHHARFPLVVAANRDEFYQRPTAAAEFWQDQPEILAGRDLEAGGTWLGLSRRGRFAALTNFRNPQRVLPNPPSRGELVSSFLTSPEDADSYGESLLAHAADYNGFGLLLYDGVSLHYVSNGLDLERRTLGPGLYGLSNHMLDTPWPKVSNGKRAVQRCLDEDADVNCLFDIMANQDLAADGELPDTRVGLELERRYSAAFVKMESYGTRSTSVTRVSHGGEVEFFERTYDLQGAPHEDRVYGFSIQPGRDTRVLAR